MTITSQRLLSTTHRSLSTAHRLLRTKAMVSDESWLLANQTFSYYRANARFNQRMASARARNICPRPSPYARRSIQDSAAGRALRSFFAIHASSVNDHRSDARLPGDFWQVGITE